MVRWVTAVCGDCQKERPCRRRKALGKAEQFRCSACAIEASNEDHNGMENTKEHLEPVLIQRDVSNVEPGDRCRLKTGEIGVVAFVGQVEDKPGEFVGLLLDTPIGKNDGSVNGKVYFKARPNHGVFVRQNEIAEKLERAKSYIVLDVEDTMGEKVHKKPAYVLMTPEGEPKYLIRDRSTVTKMYAFRNGPQEPPDLLFTLRGAGLLCLGDSPKSESVGKLKKLPDEYQLFPGDKLFEKLVGPNGKSCNEVEDYFEARSITSFRNKKSKSERILGNWKINLGGPRVSLDQREATTVHVFVDFQNELKDALAHYLVVANLPTIMDVVRSSDKQGKGSLSLRNAEICNDLKGVANMVGVFLAMTPL